MISGEKEMTTHSSVLAGEFHGQRSLESCSLWGCRQSDTTEATQHECLHIISATSESSQRISDFILALNPSWFLRYNGKISKFINLAS